MNSSNRVLLGPAVLGNVSDSEVAVISEVGVPCHAKDPPFDEKQHEGAVVCHEEITEDVKVQG